MDRVQQLNCQQAQREADHGVLSCRVCKRLGPLDEGITIWRGGILVYGMCDSCLHDRVFLIKPTERGIEVKGKRVAPLVI